MRIVLFNQPISNRGDESAHKAVLRALSKRFPQAEIKVLFPDMVNGEPFIVHADNVEYVQMQKFHPNRLYSKFIKVTLLCKHLRLLWRIAPGVRQHYSLMKSADYNICFPGGIDMGGFQSWGHVFMLQLAKATGKPLAYYSRSFGPFPTTTLKNRWFKKLSIDVLHYFDFMSFRDSKSCKLAEDLGLNYVSTVDSAFLDYPEVEIPSDIAKKIGSDYVVFVPNLLIWHYAYRGRIARDTVINFFAKMANILMEKFPTSKIVMLPQTYGYTDEANGNDEYFFHEIEPVVKNERLVIVPDHACDSDAQQCIIRKARLMVGARYHSVVFAINNNVPFVALNYEHKISGLLETLGKQDRMVDIVHAMDNSENEKVALNLFMSKLEYFQPDPDAQQKAKAIANNCMDKFIDKINET